VMQSLCLGTGRMRRFDHPVSGSHKLRHSSDLAEVASRVSAESRENCKLDRQRNPKVARWSAQNRGIPRSSRLTVSVRGWAAGVAEPKALRDLVRVNDFTLPQAAHP